MTSSDTPDTGAGTPLDHGGTMDGPNTHRMAAPADVTNWTTIRTTRDVVTTDGRGFESRDEWWHVPTFVVEAIEAAARSRPATDPAGLDAHDAILALPNPYPRTDPRGDAWASGVIAAANEARRLADGPGPEEPEGWCYRYWGSDGTLCAQHHERFATPTATRCAALSRPLPENREEPSR